MRILYIGIHAILEYEELKIFTEMGHDCFSVDGAYTDPKGHYLLPRPGIPGMTYHDDLHKISRQYPRTDLPVDLIDWADVIIVMGGYHDTEVISLNWKKFKRKKVIWRTIGQSTESTETALKPYRSEGLKIVRMSPKEKLIPNYIGEDAVIRFYKDTDEFKDWNGNTRRVVNITQSLKSRRNFCHYDDIMQIIGGQPTRIYGTGNEDLGVLNGGTVEFNVLKEVLRDNRVFIYTGTWPSPYTLTFIEALSTGIPVVAIGKDIAENIPGVKTFEFYEIQDIIQDGTNGFVSNNIEHLKKHVEELMTDYELAKRIGRFGRITAQDLFSKDKIKDKWKYFFENI